MKKISIRFLTIFLALIMILGSVPAFATGSFKETADIPYDTFIYWNNANSIQPVRATGMYNYFNTYFSEDFEGVDITSYVDVATDINDNVYILDSAVSKIHILDKNYKYVSTIDEIVGTDGTLYNYKNAPGFVVSDEGLIYICDAENKRVIISDIEGNLVNQPLVLPESNLIPDDFNYRPQKIAVDSSNYIYVLSEGSYYGAILYSPKGEFLGFFGANMVPTTITEALKTLWDKITMTTSRRAQSERKLPYQFTDLYVDKQDFIYTATGRTKREIERAQIKRLSPGGLNILESDNVRFSIHNYMPLRVREGKVYPNIEGLAISEDNYIYAYDVGTGYISIYDNDCNMLNTFAGGSVAQVDQDGTFSMISAIDLNSQKDIIVIDEVKKCLTVYKINEHGKLLMQAGTLTKDGDYDTALPLWQKVLQNDRNCQVAYSGIAKSYYAAGDYQKSMEYAKQGYDYDTYSLSFEFVRRNYIEKYIYLFAGIIVALVAIVAVFVYYKRKNKWVIIKNYELKLLSRSILHPSDVFNEIKEKKKGSTLIGSLLIILYYITATIKETESGFLFKSASNTSFNSLLVLIQTLGIVLLWTICNWAVCTLSDGKGKMREIYIVTSYSLLPLIISNIVYAIASNVILASEAAFLSIFVTVMQLLTAFMLIIGTIIIHDYTFGKFVGTSILSILGILIVIFIGIVIVILVQQLLMFCGTVYREFVYR